jgi:hypothetical protein
MKSLVPSKSYRDDDLKELDVKIQERLCTLARAVESIPLVHPYNIG